MQPYKPYNHSRSIGAPIARAGLVLVAVTLLFLIVDALVTAVHVPSLRSGGVRHVLSSKRDLLRTIEEQDATIASLRIAEETSAMLRKENESLKKELGRSVGEKGVVARVLTLPNRNFYDTVIIDAGREEGVVEGQLVYAFDTVVLGTVVETTNHRSTVELFSAPGKQTSGTSEGSDLSITLIGRGAGEYEVRMPRDVQFTLGEIISYQSMESVVLARIEHIATDPRDPFQKLFAKIPVNLNTLKFVMVR